MKLLLTVLALLCAGCPVGESQMAGCRAMCSPNVVEKATSDLCQCALQGAKP
jgi:hypothetical protein